MAAIAAFAMDLHGDGTLAEAEQFDLAAVAGADGTVQVYRVPDSGPY